MRFSAILLVVTFALAGCVGQKLAVPYGNEREIEAEKHAQERALHGVATLDYSTLRYSASKKKKMVKRMQGIINRLSPHAIEFCRDLGVTDKRCTMLVEIGKGVGVNAHADGRKIVVYPALMDFAKSDNDVAFIVSHEYAHQILGHIAATRRNMMIGGMLGMVADVAVAANGGKSKATGTGLGAQTARLFYSPALELEADYAALYLLARAGFDYRRAPEFWQKMNVHNPDSIYVQTTHPTTPARYVTMQKTIAEIERKKRDKRLLIPNSKLN